ncbi:MAG: N-formylglutamate amidohydrolase [Sphingobium sp.]|nr:N-formylglutamate amidohydrolase [Sphingobium sp.]
MAEQVATEAFTWMSGGKTPILIVADHASAHVPDDIDLGIDPALLNNHIAVDIGVAQVAALLVERLQCSALLGGVSRLVIDLNREETSSGLIPVISDGHKIAGNEGVDRAARIARFYHPYHDELTARLSAMAHPFIFSLHSFTPFLKEKPEEKRPWEIGILYNQDERAARLAIPMLEEAGAVVGDQQPYSGRILNATMNRHAEGAGHPYLGVEMRQDISGTSVGQRYYTDLLAPVLEQCRALLA